MNMFIFEPVFKIYPTLFAKKPKINEEGLRIEVMKRALRVFAMLVLAGCVIGLALQPLSAQVAIPEGSTIDSAIFSVYVVQGSFGTTVNVHRITADWGESSATWNSFGGNFDPGIVGSFSPSSVGWYSIDVTDLVQFWADGTMTNFGILVEQGLTAYAVFASSEAVTVELRPKLDIWYTTPALEAKHITIQRPGIAQDGVADLYIWEPRPEENNSYDLLYTGAVADYEKYSLIRFNFTVTSACTRTPGCWMNHPEAWPADEILIGGILYTKAEAIKIMKKEVRTDKTFTMFDALVATKLNVLMGNADTCIADSIDDADAWMEDYGPVGSGVAAGGAASPWRSGEPLYKMLDKYNNGLLDCAWHCY